MNYLIECRTEDRTNEIFIKAQDKRPKSYDGIEKYILRKAFDTPNYPYLPDEAFCRQKEQFSDGVGHSWVDELVAHCNKQVSDFEMKRASEKYPNNTPTS